HQARFDVLADRAGFDARARAWMPDAQLAALVTVGVRPDGTADLDGGAYVAYSYLSGERAASTDLKVLGRCLWMIHVKDGDVSAYELTNDACTDLRVPGPPRCTFVDIWARAVDDGADPGRPARIEYLPTATGSQWSFASGTFGHQYPDDC
ncbi:MAG: hypothetical protein KC464_32145, partial [Myxococcales bacterium]|nr:hypothetical protein [Myxococcales bacterium]